MVTSVLVVYPDDHVADWKMQLSVAPSTPAEDRERGYTMAYGSAGKISKSKPEVLFELNTYHLISQTILN